MDQLGGFGILVEEADEKWALEDKLVADFDEPAFARKVKEKNQLVEQASSYSFAQFTLITEATWAVTITLVAFVTFANVVVKAFLMEFGPFIIIVTCQEVVTIDFKSNQFQLKLLLKGLVEKDFLLPLELRKESFELNYFHLADLRIH